MLPLRQPASPHLHIKFLRYDLSSRSKQTKVQHFNFHSLFQALEKFSTLMKEISSKLDDFMHEIVDCDMGNDPTQTKELLDCQESRLVYLNTVILRTKY